MNANIQVQVLNQAISSLSFFIKNADLTKETNIDLIFGDDMGQSAIDALQEIASSFDSYQYLQNNEIVTAGQLEEILSDFTSELETLKSK